MYAVYIWESGESYAWQWVLAFVPGNIQKKQFLVCQFKEIVYICSRKRELSSAGSEHLPYKQGVTGSNPVGPTSLRKPRNDSCGVFAFQEKAKLV